MNSSQAMLDVAVAAARAAADLIRRAAADPAALQIRLKQPNDFVTQVDLASERLIVGRLLDAFPGHAVRSEESAQPHGMPGAQYVWIVDPLDGTTNFIHGYAAYAVSIALAVRGRIELGVVLDVAHGELFHASRGGGAWGGAWGGDSQRLHVAPRERLADAVVATSCPYRAGPGLEVSMQMLGAVMGRAHAIRRSGSAALDLAWLAAGRCDASFDLGLNAWDVAAGSLLVTEAGGRVVDFDGGDDFLEGRSCIAGNAALCSALGAILHPFAPRRGPSNRHET